MSLIEQKFQECCKNTSDINQLLPILRAYADNCEHVTEMGVRYVTSSWALLASKAKLVVSYDINYNDFIDNCIKICGTEGRPWSFILDSSLSCDIEPTDMLFIDTFHTYGQLKAELNLHSTKVRKWILMHDVETYGKKSENGYFKGLHDAIEEFVNENKNYWKLKEIYRHNNGLAVLERI